MAAPRLAVLPWALALAGGLAACAGILGIDDRTPFDGDASIEAGGDAPSMDVQALDAMSDVVVDTSTNDVRVLDGGSDAPVDASPGLDAPTVDAPTSDAPAPMEAGVVDAPSDAPICPDPCLLAPGLNHPFAMVADANNVYWTELGDALGSGNGSVKSCPAAGCGAGGPTILAQGLTNPRGIAIDSQYVYFVTATYGGVNGGIWRCAIGGCGGDPTMIAPATIPYGVAVDATSVYWTDNDEGTVNKVDKGDGGLTTLYDGGAYDDAGDTLDLPGQCVVDGPYLYFMDYSEDAVRVPIGGGAITYLGSGFNNVVYGNYFGLTTDSANLYFGGNGVVFRSVKANPGPMSTAANNVSVPLGLQFDPATGMVYWANFGSGTANDGTVGKFATDGGGPHILQASLATPEAVAVGSSYVYWVSFGTYDNTIQDYAPSTGVLWRTTK
jgi:hypothetical protein